MRRRSFTVDPLRNIIINYKSFIDGKVGELQKYADTFDPEKHRREYIEESIQFKEADIADEIKKPREEAIRHVNEFIDLEKSIFDKFISKPLTKSLADKLTTFRANNITLNQREFDLLCEEAHSFYDLRLLSQFAQDQNANKSTTSKTTQVDSLGEVKSDNMSDIIGNQLASIKFNTNVDLDINSVYSSLEALRGDVTFTIENYSGIDMRLKNAVKPLATYSNLRGETKSRERSIGDVASLTMALDKMEKYATPDSSSLLDECSNRITPFYSMLPDKKVGLTKGEKALVDRLVDPRFPLVANISIKEIVNESPEMIDLFERDERYCDLVEKIDLSNNN